MATLYILGMPLAEKEVPPQSTLSKISEASVIIGESRSITDRHLTRLKIPRETPVFYLDNIKKSEEDDLTQTLRAKAKTNEMVVLFSDMGMPMLFDPGQNVLKMARQLGYEIRSLPGPTSWGSAMALSGFSPPFLVVGFLPVKKEDRIPALKAYQKPKHHLVFLETPYRFEALLADCTHVFGQSAQAFLGWELGGPKEKLLWGSLAQLGSSGFSKGEFILIIQAA